MKRPEDELKQLLLASELDLLERLRQRCEFLETRVGDDPSMRDSVRAIILDALREAGVRDHDRLAKILAPLVLTSMREEIRNSKDMMVDALYPITGRIVAAGIAVAFREMMETLNEKLDNSFSLDRWKVRIRAKATGRSEAELQLERNPPFEIDDLLLVHRQTGLLIARARDQEDAGEGVDSDLVGGMLAAIMAFTRDAMGDETSGDLRTLSFGDSELYLRASPAVILAVKARGTAPKAFQGALEALFVEFLDTWGDQLRHFDGAASDEEKTGLIADLRERFAALEVARRNRFRGKSNTGILVLAPVVLAIFLWGGYAAYQSWRVADIVDTAQRVVSGEPAVAGYPIEVRFDDDADRLVVEGLLSDQDARDRLQRSLAAALPGVDAQFQLNFLPRGEIERIARDYAAIAARFQALEETAARLDGALAGAVAALEDQTGALGQRTGDLEDRVTGFQNSFEAMSGSLDAQLRQFERQARDLQEMTSGLEVSIGSVSDGLGSQLEEQSGNLRTMAERFETSVDSWSRLLGARLDQLDRRLAALEQAGPTPLDQLESWIARNTVYFADGTEFKSPVQAEAKLRDLAQLVLAAPPAVRLRVAGYSDASGSAAANQAVSEARARAVAEKLGDMNVSPDRLVLVGRAAERPISGSGPFAEENRRVEFELSYPEKY